MSKLAVIAGAGGLPAALVSLLPQRPLVCALEGFAPAGLAVDSVFRIERLMPFLRHLQDSGITDVTFAGAVQRPRLDPALFDPSTAQMVPRLLGAMQAGDDGALRAVIGLFEEAGFAVRGLAEIAPALLPAAGLYAGRISPQDEADAARAAAILAAMSAVDLGQACVVAQGQCLGLEVLSGTDAMLAEVAGLGQLRAALGRGLLYKAPKLGQDLRVDLPTLGLATVQGAAAAGLGGIVFPAGGVICLDLPAMQAAATEAGLFLWAR